MDWRRNSNVAVHRPRLPIVLSAKGARLHENRRKYMEQAVSLSKPMFEALNLSKSYFARAIERQSPHIPYRSTSCSVT